MDAMSSNDLVRLLFGLIVLLAGRNIFWLFIGAIGFLVGMDLAGNWAADLPVWMTLVAGILAGIVGAILAIVYERFAFALAGFYAVAFLAVIIGQHLGYPFVPYPVVILAGAVGAIATVFLTDWAIIVFSAIAGAAAVATAISATPAVQAITLLVLSLVGIFFQRAMLARGSSRLVNE
jgi:hypothetical protein